MPELFPTLWAVFGRRRPLFPIKHREGVLPIFLLQQLQLPGRVGAPASTGLRGRSELLREQELLKA